MSNLMNKRKAKQRKAGNS